MNVVLQERKVKMLDTLAKVSYNPTGPFRPAQHHKCIPVASSGAGGLSASSPGTSSPVISYQ